MDALRFQRAFLLILVVAVSAVFVAMIRGFLMSLLLAAVLAGLCHPFYRRILGRCRGRRAVSSLLTVILLGAVVILPMLALLGVVAAEALKISNAAIPWIEKQLSSAGSLPGLLDRLPFQQEIEPFRDQLMTKAGEIVAGAGTFVFNTATSATKGTVALMMQAFVLVYAMFFFLMDGEFLLKRILFYLPLDEKDERRLLDRFTSVTRATVKGTLLIGIAQGGMAGAAFWAAGVEGAVFWGAIMAVFSIIPGIGTGLVWVPAAVILIISGEVLRGVLLALFCGLIVGSVDNLLRPRLVGRDTKLHDLLIFLGTVGGILFFGVLGFLIGPIVAALLVTVWDLYGASFSEFLPGGREEA